MTKQLGVLVIFLGINAVASAQSTPTRPVPSLNNKDTASAASSELPLSYRVWKEQQILDAQNALLRAQNSLRTADSDSRPKLEKEVRRASDQVDIAKDFTVDEYLDLSLSKYQDKPELVLQMIEKLPKEEAKEILTGTFRKAFRQNNAKQKQPALMVGSSHP